MREQHRIVLDFLRDQGATDVRLEQPKRGHPRAVYVWKGREQFYVLPGTPGDTINGAKNSLTDLKRLLGLTKRHKTTGKRRTARNHAKPLPPPPPSEVTVFRDPTLVLLNHPTIKAELPARVDRLWLEFWRECMKASGGESVLTKFGAYRP